VSCLNQGCRSGTEMNAWGGAARRPVAAAMDAISEMLRRAKFGNRSGASKGATPMSAKRGPRNFYKGKGAASTGRLTSKGPHLLARPYSQNCLCSAPRRFSVHCVPWSTVHLDNALVLSLKHSSAVIHSSGARIVYWGCFSCNLNHRLGRRSLHPSGKEAQGVHGS
jgi:hypothetical protein